MDIRAFQPLIIGYAMGVKCLDEIRKTKSVAPFLQCGLAGTNVCEASKDKYRSFNPEK